FDRFRVPRRTECSRCFLLLRSCSQFHGEMALESGDYRGRPLQRALRSVREAAPRMDPRDSRSHSWPLVPGAYLMRNAPLVSFVIAARNAERYLPVCLRRIRQQTYPQSSIEILVVDGGSTDRTCEIATAEGAT